MLDVDGVYVAEGSLATVTGNELEIKGLRLRLGDTVAIRSPHGERVAEVVELHPGGATALVLGSTTGLGRGDRVVRMRTAPGAVVGPELVGRVLDGLGRPLDDGPPPAGEAVALDQEAPPALARHRIDRPIATGIRVVDTLCTVGKGQRIGIFGGSGVGKSTLLGMVAKGTDADVNVVALVGERGREVREFVEDELGPDGMERSVVIVATSDQPALVRVRAALLAMRIAEWFADEGHDVLLMVDSLTRLAMAQREVGLAAAEPPTARGYTPSVFSLLPRYLERSGPRAAGSITGIFTVLVDGDDMNDPIADATRAILDGHLVLDRKLAVQGRYPAVDPLASLSRLAAKLWTPEQERIVTAVRSALAAAAEVQELVEVGAYVPGTNPRADKGLAATPHLVDFFRQRPDEIDDFDGTWRALTDLALQMELV